jgi:hypothetical protein
MSIFFSAGRLFSPSVPILQDDFVNDLATRDASPSKIIFCLAIKFFEGHRASTSVTFHRICLPITNFILIYSFNLEISRWAIKMIQTGRYKFKGLGLGLELTPILVAYLRVEDFP